MAVCSARACHASQEQLSHMMSRMWEPNHWFGTGSPCKAISKLCIERKRGHQIACFQLEHASTSKQTVTHGAVLYRDMALTVIYSGTKGENMHIFSVGKSRNAAVTVHARKVIHKPANTNTGSSSPYRERKERNPLCLVSGMIINTTTILLGANEPLFPPCWLGRLIPELT